MFAAAARRRCPSGSGSRGSTGGLTALSCSLRPALGLRVVTVTVTVRVLVGRSELAGLRARALAAAAGATVPVAPGSPGQ